MSAYATARSASSNVANSTSSASLLSSAAEGCGGAGGGGTDRDVLFQRVPVATMTRLCVLWWAPPSSSSSSSSSPAPSNRQADAPSGSASTSHGKKSSSSNNKGIVSQSLFCQMGRSSQIAHVLKHGRLVARGAGGDGRSSPSPHPSSSCHDGVGSVPPNGGGVRASVSVSDSLACTFSAEDPTFLPFEADSALGHSFLHCPAITETAALNNYRHGGGGGSSAAAAGSRRLSRPAASSSLSSSSLTVRQLVAPSRYTKASPFAPLHRWCGDATSAVGEGEVSSLSPPPSTASSDESRNVYLSTWPPYAFIAPSASPQQWGSRGIGGDPTIGTLPHSSPPHRHCALSSDGHANGPLPSSPSSSQQHLLPLSRIGRGACYFGGGSSLSEGHGAASSSSLGSFPSVSCARCAAEASAESAAMASLYRYWYRHLLCGAPAAMGMGGIGMGIGMGAPSPARSYALTIAAGASAALRSAVSREERRQSMPPPQSFSPSNDSSPIPLVPNASHHPNLDHPSHVLDPLWYDVATVVEGVRPREPLWLPPPPRRGMSAPEEHISSSPLMPMSSPQHASSHSHGVGCDASIGDLLCAHDYAKLLFSSSSSNLQQEQNTVVPPSSPAEGLAKGTRTVRALPRPNATVFEVRFTVCALLMYVPNRTPLNSSSGGEGDTANAPPVSSSPPFSQQQQYPSLGTEEGAPMAPPLPLTATLMRPLPPPPAFSVDASCATRHCPPTVLDFGSDAAVGTHAARAGGLLTLSEANPPRPSPSVLSTAAAAARPASLSDALDARAFLSLAGGAPPLRRPLPSAFPHQHSHAAAVDRQHGRGGERGHHPLSDTHNHLHVHREQHRHHSGDDGRRDGAIGGRRAREVAAEEGDSPRCRKPTRSDVPPQWQQRCSSFVKSTIFSERNVDDDEEVS